MILFGLIGLVLIFICGLMSLGFLFTLGLLCTCKSIWQFLVVACADAVLCTATYYAFKFDHTGALTFAAGLLWWVEGIVLCTWLDFGEVQNRGFYL